MIRLPRMTITLSKSGFSEDEEDLAGYQKPNLSDALNAQRRRQRAPPRSASARPPVRQQPPK